MKYEKSYLDIHLLEVQNQIKEENRHKAGIYMILNKINNKKYKYNKIITKIINIIQ